MSAWTCRHTDGKVVQKIVPPRPRIPYWKGLGADSEEKHEPASDIDTALVDSLKVLDPEGPIREADIVRLSRHFRKVPRTASCTAALLDHLATETGRSHYPQHLNRRACNMSPTST